MPLGEIPIFSWKSKATKAKEAAEYEKWAFPHGQKQRENLEKLLLAIFPKEIISHTLIPFLTCKELYETVIQNNSCSSDDAVDLLINTTKNYKRIIKKDNMTTYIALVLADARIDENAEYPTAESILQHRDELEKLRRKD